MMFKSYKILKLICFLFCASSLLHIWLLGYHHVSNTGSISCTKKQVLDRVLHQALATGLNRETQWHVMEASTQVNNETHLSFTEINSRRVHLISEDNHTVFQYPYGPLPPRCERKVYNTTSMPTVSMIITYHDNENVLPIVRTIESLVKRTPRHLLREIVLVDDHSTKEEITAIMGQYISDVYGNQLIKMIKNNGNPGLIQARDVGIRKASGEVIICLDSHMEVQHRWLEPLLEAIQEQEMTLASSYLDWISYVGTENLWYYKIGGSTWKTYFDWEFTFGFQDIPEYAKKTRPDHTAVIESPVMVGTLWAMKKRDYITLRGFDTNLQGWGGENIDLPLKVWLSGGRVVNVPCSHAGHLEEPHSRIYRNVRTWQDKIKSNYKYMALKWFGNYTKYFHIYSGQQQELSSGTPSSNISFKTNELSLKHDFHWFLNTVYPELGVYDRNAFAFGWLQSTRFNTCLTVIGLNSPGLFPCAKHRASQQLFTWNKSRDLRLSTKFVDASTDAYPTLQTLEAIGRFARLTTIHWHHFKGKHLYVNLTQYKLTETNSSFDITKLYCLSADTEYTVSLRMCNQQDTAQYWAFETYTDENSFSLERLFS